MGFEITTITISKTAFLICLGLTFTLGTICGYQLKSWRKEWLKRKRDRLVRKIQQTQAEIEALQKS